MSDYVFGSYILEILTAGMYQDSRIIFREYIQNSCDAIDKAASLGILDSREEGEISIEIDPDSRNIVIQDNGTGISSKDFARIMSSIADSEKKQSENKGFRGIGKLCGLAYCKTAVFTTKFYGENVVSKLVCDAGVMRELIGEDAENNYKALDILNLINDFTSEPVADDKDIDAHYFRVELRDINKENTELLNVDRVREYLSFVAPLPYHMGFNEFGTMIHRHAEQLGQKIDEYNIYLNSEQLFKMYARTFLTGKGKASDKIFNLHFENFRDINNNLIAWMWIGISNFSGAIEEKCPMRGIRLRKENIQIGDGDTLRQFFAESRGIHYFIGELFCVSKDFIPNSRRDYFNENPKRVEFEKQLRNYCKSLSRLYHDGSVISSSFRKIDEAKKKREEFADRVKIGSFANDEEMQIAREELQKAQEDAAAATENISKLRTNGSKLAVSIIKNIEESREIVNQPNSKRPDNSQFINTPEQTKFTQREQRLIKKILEIIKAELEPSESKRLINIIQDRLK